MVHEDTAPHMPERSSCINLSLEEHQEGLKTTLGNHIKRLLGLDDDLVKYDDLRFKLKAATKAGNGVHMTTSISEYNKLGAKFKTKRSNWCGLNEQPNSKN